MDFTSVWLARTGIGWLGNQDFVGHLGFLDGGEHVLRSQQQEVQMPAQTFCLTLSWICGEVG
jgi:hypothetical protein